MERFGEDLGGVISTKESSPAPAGDMVQLSFKLAEDFDSVDLEGGVGDDLGGVMVDDGGVRIRLLVALAASKFS